MVVYVCMKNNDRMGYIGRSVTISTPTHPSTITITSTTPPRLNTHTGKEKKALPVPDMEPKKKRGGKRCVRLVRFWCLLALQSIQSRAYVFFGVRARHPRPLVGVGKG